MTDPNTLQTKDLILIIISLSAFLISFYGIFIINRKGFKLSTFNAVVTLNKELNQYFDNFSEKTKLILEKTKEIESKQKELDNKKKNLEKKNKLLSKITKNLNYNKNLKTLIEDLELSIKNNTEERKILLHERKTEAENCMNIMDIIYFGAFKLNIANDEFRYNFSKIFLASIKSFENARYDWVKNNYKEVCELSKHWEKLDNKDLEKEKISKNLVYLSQNLKEIPLLIYQIIKNSLEIHFIKTIIKFLNKFIWYLGLLLILVIIFQSKVF